MHSGIVSMWLLVLLLATAFPAARAAGQAVTVYRCTDSRGQLVALRDSPCRSGEHQETVQMQRPQDPPPRSATTRPATAPADAAAVEPTREVRVVTVQAPAPLYECFAQDGTSYLSETADGTQRWVPLWTMGYPVAPGPRPLPRSSAPPVTPRSARPPVSGPRPPLRGVVVPAGTWMQDECVRLSQDEVCTRLSDRHYEILRIYHAAMPSEREQLDREQRQVDEHLANHCPGY